MDIAKFLEQPIRFNPRRASVLSASMSGSLSPSPSYEGTTTSSLGHDAASSSERRFSSTQNPTPPQTSPSLVDENDQRSEQSGQPSTSPEPTTEIVAPRRHRATKERKGITKAACSSCQRRKSKVRLKLAFKHIPITTSTNHHQTV